MSTTYKLQGLARRAKTEYRRLLALAEDIKTDAPVPNFMQSRAMNAAHDMFTLIGELLTQADCVRKRRKSVSS